MSKNTRWNLNKFFRNIPMSAQGPCFVTAMCTEIFSKTRIVTGKVFLLPAAGQWSHQKYLRRLAQTACCGSWTTDARTIVCTIIVPNGTPATSIVVTALLALNSSSPRLIIVHGNACQHGNVRPNSTPVTSAVIVIARQWALGDIINRNDIDGNINIELNASWNMFNGINTQPDCVIRRYIGARHAVTFSPSICLLTPHSCNTLSASLCVSAALNTSARSTSNIRTLHESGRNETYATEKSWVIQFSAC